MPFELIDYKTTKIYEIPGFRKYKNVVHGFTTRHGGYGAAPFDTLNLALHVGDYPDTVIKNREIMCSVAGVKTDDLITSKQVHSPNVTVVDETYRGRGAFSYETAIPDTDGLITNKPELLLATFYADCVPLFIFDPVKNVIACIHSGWKGTVSRIGAKAIRKMTEVFGSSPADCLVGIGPSIGPCCYEVDNRVIEIVKNNFAYWSELLSFKNDAQAELNLWKTNFNIFVEAGVKPENIEIAEICTCCNQQDLFSYRGSSGRTGRMAAFIMLKQNA